MPLYEYQCDACGHRFESIQKFSDPPRTECPKCGAAIRKLQSAPAIQFKGSGWYITDYARKDSAPSSSDGATTEGKTDSKTESKDAKTPDTKAADTAEKRPEKKSDSAPAANTKTT